MFLFFYAYIIYIIYNAVINLIYIALEHIHKATEKIQKSIFHNTIKNALPPN